MKKMCTLEQMETLKKSSLKEALDVDQNGSHVEIRLASFNKQLDKQPIISGSQKCSLISVPVQKIKILHSKGTVIPVNSVPIVLKQHNLNDGKSFRVASPINFNEGRIQIKPVTCASVGLQIQPSKFLVSNTAVQNRKNIEDECDNQLISPSSRWLVQPRSYKGAKRDNPQRKVVRKVTVPSFVDTTDGETSGMGSSVDEPIESSTESASEASTSFLQPKLSLRPLSMSPLAFKKRRGGWPKGRKRKPELPGTKPPKAPLTAYVLFLNERRKYYKETDPHLPFVEVTKLLGAEWSSMTPEQKSVYVTRSEQDKRRYRSELQTYRQSHDYQILLRKKRMKNAINRGQTTEESSDFTDEVDDDESEELYCRTCEQWFSSLHNKREHLYGKPHLQAITGEYQREREAEEKRQSSASPPSVLINDTNSEGDSKEDENSTDFTKEPEADESFDPLLLKLDNISTRRDSIGVTSTTEDDPDDEEDEEDGEYDGEEEVTEEEGSTEYWNSASDSERVTDAAEGVIHKVINREKEIRFLRGRYDKSRRHNRNVLASLLNLQARHKHLKEVQERLLVEEKNLLQQAEDLVKMSEFCDFKIGGVGFGSNLLPTNTAIVGYESDNSGLSAKDTDISGLQIKDVNFLSSLTNTSEINKLLGHNSNAKPELEPEVGTKVRRTLVTSNEDSLSGSSTSTLPYDKDISIINSSQIFLPSAKSSRFSSKTTTSPSLENTKLYKPIFSLVQPNESVSFIANKCIPNAIRKKCSDVIEKLDSSKELINIREESCATNKDKNSILTVSKREESCLVSQVANSAVLSHARKKLIHSLVTETASKEEILPNVTKCKEELDHSYSKSRYSPIPSRRKGSNVKLKTLITGTLDDAQNVRVPEMKSQSTRLSQGTKNVENSLNYQINQRNYETTINANSIRIKPDLILNDERGSVKNRTTEGNTNGTSTINPIAPLCLPEDYPVELKQTDEDYLFSKYYQTNQASFNNSISRTNFIVPTGSRHEENSFVFPCDEDLLPETSPNETPDLVYFDTNLDDVGNSIDANEFRSLQWDDISFIEEAIGRQNINALPILDNIFEEDYLSNLLNENSS